MENMNLPCGVDKIINTLKAHGYEGYAVGGCVRDSILGREPNDWDITTNATPVEVKRLFNRTIDTGIQHGTVTVMLDHVGYEVTTYRIDGKYSDGRHPEQVTFTINLEDDLLRRDFTINAMAYNKTSGLVDLYGGIEDLKNGVIRCVGDAHARFTEDALRILRAVRFGAQLGFTIQKETKQAAADLAENLKLISAERIQVELVKLLTSPHPDYIEMAFKLGMTGVFLPELTQVTDYMKRRLLAVEPDKHLREAMLLCDLEPETVQAILRRLRLDNDTIQTVTKLVGHSRDDVPTDAGAVRHSIYQVGVELYPRQLKLWKALAVASASAGLDDRQDPDRKHPMGEKQVQAIEGIYQMTLAEGCCLSLKDLAVKGRDLMEAGITGKAIGNTLDAMLMHVLDCPEDNVKEILMESLMLR